MRNLPYLFLLSWFAFLARTGPALADNALCLDCHANAGMVGKRGGKSISVVVDPNQLRESVHRSTSCAACHPTLANDNLAHAQGGMDPPAVDCGACHKEEQAQHNQSYHGVAASKGDIYAPTCKECHGTHHILPPTDPDSPTYPMNVPATCGRCHHEGSDVERSHTDIPQESILENYSESIHGEGLFQQGLLVTAVCTSCHTAHLALPHTDERSSTSRNRVAATCATCHVRIEQVHEKIIEGRLWEAAPHQIPTCTECHSPHKIRASVNEEGLGNDVCQACHGDVKLVGRANGKDGVSLFVNESGIIQGAHGRTPCVQCHTQAQASLERPCETINRTVQCETCHAEETRSWTNGTHGKLALQGDPDAPTCLTCHDKHATGKMTWTTSSTFPGNEPTLCGQCHGPGGKAAVRIEKDGESNAVESFRTSVHGRGLLEAGLVVTASCSDCHGAHQVLPPSDPTSSVSHQNVASTCGTCHQGIADTFVKSVHGSGTPPEGKTLPTCEECHTSHSIQRSEETTFQLSMMEQCGRCHSEQADTFFTSYHGKVTQLGRKGAATCYDCHGSHGVLPTSDPASTLSPENAVKTCAQCHPKAGPGFTQYITHATHDEPDRYPFLFLAFWAMTALLSGTLVFFSIHTGAWLFRILRSRDEWRHLKAAHGSPEERLVERFPAKARLMHLTLVLSFFTLAITGMALKFSYAPWAQWVSHALGGPQIMGLLHRVGATVMSVLFFYHVVDLFRARRASGATWLGFIFGKTSLFFNLQDLRDILAAFKWFLGRGPRPGFGRFTYWEKFDYFAVFWGMTVIGSSGLMLWFPEQATRVLPGWLLNVATIVHSDEALLATAFIFTIHFFNTHFRPDKFPMDTVMFTGRISVEELKYDKPAEYQDLVASGKLESRIVAPLPASTVRWFRVFGFTALAVGVAVVVTIAVTMVMHLF